MEIKQDFETTLRLSFQRAMLGEITPNMRLITVGWNEKLTELHVTIYFDKEVTEEDEENINNITAEVFADIDFKSEKIACVYDTRPLGELDVLRFIAYARKE